MRAAIFKHPEQVWLGSMSELDSSDLLLDSVKYMPCLLRFPKFDQPTNISANRPSPRIDHASHETKCFNVAPPGVRWE